MSMTILAQVKGELGTAATFTDAMFDEIIKRWQKFFQDAIVLSDTDIYDETKWPLLWNSLIVKLVIREQIIASVKSSIGTSLSTGKGGLKRIETGPSSAEWYQPTESSKSLMSSGSNMADSMDSEICELANKLGVRLSICRKLKKPIVFSVVKKCDNE